MDIIQQIAVKAVEEIFESVKGTGLSDIGKTIKALTPVVSRTVLSILTAFLEKMDEDLVTGAKALRREDGITVKEAKMMSAGIQYSLRVDTSKQSPDECADAILNALF